MLEGLPPKISRGFTPKISRGFSQIWFVAFLVRIPGNRLLGNCSRKPLRQFHRSLFQATTMVSCFVKTIVYLVLIVFNVVDFCCDFCEWSELYAKQKFISMQVENNLTPFLLFVSWAIGLLVCAAMLFLYGSYIKDHFFCTFHGCNKKCAPGFFELEFQFSSMELWFKDAIQSGLFLCHWSLGEKTPCVHSLTKGFVLCSILAHAKLSVCFWKNYFSYQEKERHRGKFGFVSLFFSGLTFLYYTTDIHHVPTC